MNEKPPDLDALSPPHFERADNTSSKKGPSKLFLSEISMRLKSSTTKLGPLNLGFSNTNLEFLLFFHPWSIDFEATNEIVISQYSTHVMKFFLSLSPFFNQKAKPLISVQLWKRSYPFYAVPIINISKAASFLTVTLSNTFLFLFLRSFFKARSSLTSTQLGPPLNLYFCHHSLIRSLKPSTFNHIFSNPLSPNLAYVFLQTT